MPRRRALTETDLADWGTYARHIRRLPGRAPVLLEPPPPPPARLPAPPLSPAMPPVRERAIRRDSVGQVVIGLRPPGIDSTTWTRLASGRMAVQRRLDLHGRTADRAFASLETFLRTAHADRLRCVEVITGRGAGEAGGILRRELPHWLNLPGLRPVILAVTYPHAGNTGSVRVLLRSRRA